MTRYALLTRGGDPHIWDFGSAAKHHRLNCPWLRQENIHAGMIGLRGRGRPGRRPVPGRRRARSRDILRAEGVADMPLGVDLVEPPMLAALEAEGITRPGRPAGDARRARGQVARRDHPAEHGLRHGRRRLPVHLASSSSRASARASSSPTSPSSCSTWARSTSTTSTPCRASAAARTRTSSATGSSGPATRPSSTSSTRSSATRPATTARSRSARANDAQRDAYKQAREWIDASIELMKPGVTHGPGRQGLAEGRGVRVLERDGVLRAPVRAQRRAVPPRAADHQPAQLARPPGRAQGGHGHRARDVLPGQGRLLRGADRGGGRRHRRRPAGHHASSRRTSCSSRTRTEDRAR